MLSVCLLCISQGLIHCFLLQHIHHCINKGFCSAEFIFSPAVSVEGHFCSHTCRITCTIIKCWAHGPCHFWQRGTFLWSVLHESFLSVSLCVCWLCAHYAAVWLTHFFQPVQKMVNMCLLVQTSSLCSLNTLLLICWINYSLGLLAKSESASNKNTEERWPSSAAGD